MRTKLLRLRTVALSAVVVVVLGFGASTALGRPPTVCDSPPVVVGSCAEPGFDCQAECDLANPEITVIGSCQQTGNQCCICIQV
ncbi:MAG: hypothetical protein ACR2HZ_00065 [Gemmatimonadaceae bacterium]|jgi:hypothetical protein